MIDKCGAPFSNYWSLPKAGHEIGLGKFWKVPGLILDVEFPRTDKVVLMDSCCESVILLQKCTARQGKDLKQAEMVGWFWLARAVVVTLCVLWIAGWCPSERWSKSTWRTTRPVAQCHVEGRRCRVPAPVPGSRQATHCKWQRWDFAPMAGEFMRSSMMARSWMFFSCMNGTTIRKWGSNLTRRLREQATSWHFAGRSSVASLVLCHELHPSTSTAARELRREPLPFSPRGCCEPQGRFDCHCGHGSWKSKGAPDINDKERGSTNQQ